MAEGVFQVFRRLSKDNSVIWRTSACRLVAVNGTLFEKASVLMQVQMARVEPGAGPCVEHAMRFLWLHHAQPMTTAQECRPLFPVPQDFSGSQMCLDVSLGAACTPPVSQVCVQCTCPVCSTELIPVLQHSTSSPGEQEHRGDGLAWE